MLDKLPGPSDEPKANGLVGQVIRQLDMRGLYHVFGGDEGAPRPAYGWMFAGIGLDFFGIDDNPMYALLIQQPRVVRLLEKRARDLGVDIRWGHELTALRPGVEEVALTVAATDRAYRLDARYLVGADGGRSTVRKNAGIGFPGNTSPIVSRLAHVSLPEELLVPGRGYEIPGFGLLPFGHNRFDDGTVIAVPDRAGSADGRHRRIRLDAGQRRRTYDARRAAREYPPHHRGGRPDSGSERAWPACASTPRRHRTRALPTGTAQGGCCCSVTPRTCIRRWVAQV